tara:strand:+ start:8339 stop:8920 length:582 start_codon:yes stop_codon:yes gene_type:complete
MKRTGLFGGSFDPIHLGHTMLAEEAKVSASLDQVLFIPCRQSPHKDEAPGASDEQRCEMIRLAIADFPWAEVSTVELEREDPSYSWQTAQYFAGRDPDAELFWILGSDQWDVIEKWANPAVLAELLTFLVFPRGSEVNAKPGFRHHFVQHAHPASATKVRNARSDAKQFLAPKVFDFVEKEGLYWEPTQTGKS